MRLMCRSHAFENDGGAVRRLQIRRAHRAEGECATAASQSDLRSGKIAPEALPLCKSEVGADFFDPLRDCFVVGGFKVEA